LYEYGCVSLDFRDEFFYVYEFVVPCFSIVTLEKNRERWTCKE